LPVSYKEQVPFEEKSDGVLADFLAADVSSLGIAKGMYGRVPTSQVQRRGLEGFGTSRDNLLMLGTSTLKE
jgi:hypothetical protein